jgi:ATP-dependent Clp protease ATP-binding subunit ClpC
LSGGLDPAESNDRNGASFHLEARVGGIVAAMPRGYDDRRDRNQERRTIAIMLPKSSARVAEVIKLANAIAREYEQEYVGTEHVLLAIQREGHGIGAAVLSRNNIHAENLRREVERLVKKRLEETWVFGRLPGTPHFRNVMALAIQQCQQLESKEVCTEHLLLALLQEKGSVAYKALQNLGLIYEQARTDVLDLSSSS